MKSTLMRTSAALTLAITFGLGAYGIPATAQAPDQAGGPPPATQPDTDPIVGEGTDHGTDADQAETDMPGPDVQEPADTASDPSAEEVWEQEGEGVDGAAGGTGVDGEGNGDVADSDD